MAEYFDNRNDCKRHRDRPFSGNWIAPPELLLDLDLTAHDVAIAAIVAEAIIGGLKGQDVSIARRKQLYLNRQRYMSDYTYDSVLAAIGLLHRRRIIVNHQVPPRNLGWQSSFSATDRLMVAWANTKAELIFRPTTETIWLRNAAKQLISYDDDDDTRIMRRAMQAGNEMRATLDIDIPCTQRRGSLLIFESGEGDQVKQTHVLRRPGNGMVRIFNRESFAFGGRMIGWHQGVPKGPRAAMTINGEATVEADFSAMHASILYGLERIKFEGDFYEIDARFHRDDHIKPAFNTALNASNDYEAVGAIIREANLDQDSAARLLAAIKRRHRPIERYFCSDAGVRLMRTESDIMADFDAQMVRAGVPVLTVHDAAIGPERSANQLEEGLKNPR